MPTKLPPDATIQRAMEKAINALPPKLRTEDRILTHTFDILMLRRDTPPVDRTDDLFRRIYQIFHAHYRHPSLTREDDAPAG